MWTYLVGPQWAKYFLLTGDSVTGRQAAEIGLVWKAVPPEQLEAEVEALAAKMAKIDIELLVPNKRICQMALELMGARTLQRMAAEMDGRAHTAPSVREFARIAREQGLKAALEWRDGRFGSGRAKGGSRRQRANPTRDDR
jgi:enoyl-CoA hydratase